MGLKLANILRAQRHAAQIKHEREVVVGFERQAERLGVNSPGSIGHLTCEPADCISTAPHCALRRARRDARATAGDARRCVARRCGLADLRVHDCPHARLDAKPAPRVHAEHPTKGRIAAPAITDTMVECRARRCDTSNTMGSHGWHRGARPCGGDSRGERWLRSGWRQGVSRRGQPTRVRCHVVGRRSQPSRSAETRQMSRVSRRPIPTSASTARELDSRKFTRERWSLQCILHSSAGNGRPLAVAMRLTNRQLDDELTPVVVSYQPPEPGLPFHGPTISLVTQPP